MEKVRVFAAASVVDVDVDVDVNEVVDVAIVVVRGRFAKKSFLTTGHKKCQPGCRKRVSVCVWLMRECVCVRTWVCACVWKSKKVSERLYANKVGSLLPPWFPQQVYGCVYVCVRVCKGVWRCQAFSRPIFPIMFCCWCDCVVCICASEVRTRMDDSKSRGGFRVDQDKVDWRLRLNGINASICQTAAWIFSNHPTTFRSLLPDSSRAKSDQMNVFEDSA